jgi:hypothetical protein
MEECFWSIRILGVYVQLTQKWKLQIVCRNNEGQYVSRGFYIRRLGG